MDVNETKLVRAIGATDLRPARPDEFEPAGIVAGYASPIGIRDAFVVVDDLVARSPNLVAGANKAGYHLLHTNIPRDYQPDLVVDIAAAAEGSAVRRSARRRCAWCAPSRSAIPSSWVPGTARRSAPRYLDEHGKEREIVMGSYGIGVGRLIACIAEQHHDERGLAWPPAVAPFSIYLVGLDLQHDHVRAAAEALYARFENAGLEVLYDDRDERAGVKFNDADLLGIPVRVTISRRTLQDEQIEIKARLEAESSRVPLAEAVEQVRRLLKQLEITKGH